MRGQKYADLAKTSVSTSFVVLIVGPLHIFELSAVTNTRKHSVSLSKSVECKFINDVLQCIALFQL